MIRFTSLMVVLAAAAGSLFVLPQLPDVMAIHWNAYGQPDGFAPKAIAVWLMPGTMLFVFALLAALAGRATGGARRPYEATALATQVFVLLVHAMMLAIGLGYALPVLQVVAFGISVLFAVIGLFMPTVTPNPVMGIRTRWTMRSPEVWRATHRFAGRLMVFGGLVLALGAVAGVSFWAIFAGFLLLGFVPVGYSLVAWRREQRLHS